MSTRSLFSRLASRHLLLVGPLSFVLFAVALPASAHAAPIGVYVTNYITPGTVSQFKIGAGGSWPRTAAQPSLMAVMRTSRR
jgi:hypothetical protein